MSEIPNIAVPLDYAESLAEALAASWADLPEDDSTS